MTDVSDAPEIENEDEPVKAPPIEPWKVEGSDGLPDDVKNGDPTTVDEALDAPTQPEI